MLLKSYDEFLQAVNECGFITMGQNEVGMPNLNEITLRSAWYCGDPDRDPSIWKNRFARDKEGVYIQLLNKHMMLSLEYYDIFRAIYENKDSIEDMYSKGLINKYAVQIERVLLEAEYIGIYDFKKLLSIKSKEDLKLFKKALAELQSVMKITISGAAKRVNKLGETVGWNGATFSLLHLWLENVHKPVDILAGQAYELLTNKIKSFNPDVEKKDIDRFLKLKNRLLL